MGLCKCGCGLETRIGNIFILGHNRRNLVSHTKGNKWSMHYDKCVKCGTTEKKHNGNGLCVSCYKKELYRIRKECKFKRWAKNYDYCIDCGRIDRPHQANGKCGTCYTNNVNRLKGKVKRNFGNWSWYYDKCQKCGTTKRRHAGDGLCCDCYGEIKRDLSKDYEICPVCNTKTIKLNQHLAMRAKKCDKHRRYQHDLLKMYFDSDLSLKDVSKELNIERHTITAQFILYFGKENTRKRNELVRRCNISENAIINHNNKNRFGTIVEYDSPNQGKIKLRSKMEAKYAKYLDSLNINWYYECKSFPYLDKNGKRRTYTPDFYLPDQDKYIEVKGYKKANDDCKIDYLRKNGINIELIEKV